MRLGVETNSAGALQYPTGADLPVSIRGLNAAGNVRTYQIWYRNSATFCTPAVFNLTNGLQVTWSS